MGRWQNFSIWRGRFPHWRADGVLYYVSVRHKRPLEEDELRLVFREFMRPNDRKWTLRALVTVAGQTEALVSVHEAPHGAPYELGDIVGRAVKRAAKGIMAGSGERWPPLYAEPYDRIMRDDTEANDFLEQMIAKVPEDDNDAGTGYQFFWIASEDPE